MIYHYNGCSVHLTSSLNKQKIKKCKVIKGSGLISVFLWAGSSYVNQAGCMFISTNKQFSLRAEEIGRAILEGH